MGIWLVQAENIYEHTLSEFKWCTKIQKEFLPLDI